MATKLDSKQSSLLLGVLLFCLLAASAWAFWPGLTGPFLFDDFPNLSDLGLFGGVHSFQSALRFILGGTAGPLGRPISLASFLLNDNTWPSDPASFKYTNLLLHLLSGTVLFSFFRQLRTGVERIGSVRHDWIALVAAAIWLLHPIQAAPIFLVVQRMTILSALFSFAAMAGWIAGRNRVSDGKPGGWLRMSLSIILGTVLASLSKENGILLPSLILALERTVAPLPSNPRTRIWRSIFLIFPSAIIAAYFVVGWHSIAAGYVGRDFTLKERLLTEPFILFDYLREIFIPGITTTIFRDDFPITSSWSLASVAAIAAWALGIGIAIWGRTRFPVLAFAILFFIIGQTLESGPVPLELYFIHRNYLPMVGIVFALAWYTGNRLKRIPMVAILCAASALVVLGITTRVESISWGREDLLVNAWADERPGSPRAAAMAANYWGQRGDYGKAIQIIERTLALHPDSPSLRVGNYYEHCLTKTESRKRWDEFMAYLPDAARDNALGDALDMLARNIRNSSCNQVTITDIVEALDLTKSNRRYSGPSDQARIDYSLAQYFLELEEPAAAIGALEHAISVFPTVYEFELLGDLYAEAGHREIAIKNYRSALAIPYFRGWRAQLFGDDKPKFDVLEQKLKNLEASKSKPVPA